MILRKLQLAGMADVGNLLFVREKKNCIRFAMSSNYANFECGNLYVVINDH